MSNVTIYLVKGIVNVPIETFIVSCVMAFLLGILVGYVVNGIVNVPFVLMIIIVVLMTIIVLHCDY